MEKESFKEKDRRFQIFIASTFEDLSEQRKQAVEVVIDRGHIPIALERFSASNESDIAVIKKAIQNCQVYILILGYRYGEIIPGKDIGYVEFEYNLAKENGLMILPFIMNDEEIQKLRKNLDSRNIKDNQELKNSDKLERFHNEIKKNFFYKPWRKDDNFKYLLVKALDDHLSECKSLGWIREQEESIRSLVESASRNEFIVDTVKQLSSFSKLDARCSQEADKKQELAAYFSEKYYDIIFSNNVSLFFESGSTVAYVARELAPSLKEAIRIEKGKPNIEISTNNVLTYLQLWLTARVPCTLFPWGPPEESYGACYGSIAGIGDHAPNYMLPLDEVAIEQIEELLKVHFTLSAMRKPVLLLGAASGLQLSKNHTIKFRAEDERNLSNNEKEKVKEELAKCFGPHVGSYRNKVFKRFIYATKLPIIILITEDKIDCTIEVGKCHFILDREGVDNYDFICTWNNFLKEHPLAFCVGCTQNSRLKYIKMFKDLDFEIYEGNNFSAITAFIARNIKFIEEFEKPLTEKKNEE